MPGPSSLLRWYYLLHCVAVQEQPLLGLRFLRSSFARFSFNVLKNSRFRFSWLSRPRCTSAAIALLNARVGSTGAPFYLMNQTRSEGDRIARCDLTLVLQS